MIHRFILFIGDTMNADSTPGNPSGKRAVLPGLAASIFHLLRMFWLFELAMLLLAVYGMRAGWSAPKQWSDGFFLAGCIQVVVAAVSTMATPRDALDAATLRWVPGSDVSDTRYDLLLRSLRIKNFGLRAFIGSVLTFLMAAVVLLFR